MQTTIVDGRTVKIGDRVSFKSDIEQSGTIKLIARAQYGGVELHLHNANGFEGEYIGGDEDTKQYAVDCWID